MLLRDSRQKTNAIYKESNVSCTSSFLFNATILMKESGTVSTEFVAK